MKKISYFIPGIKVKEHGPLLKDLFQTDYFRIVVCDDETTVEVCGALKVRHQVLLFVYIVVIVPVFKLCDTTNVYFDI